MIVGDEYLSEEFKPLRACVAQAENDLLVVVLSVLHNAEMRATLNLERYEAFWQKQRDKIHNNPRFKQFKWLFSQDTFSAFYQFAIEYLQAVNKTDEMIHYLLILAQEPHANFHAQQHLIKAVMNLSINSSLEDGIVDQAHCIAQCAVKNHHAPGFLLQAELAFMLGQYYQEEDEDRAWLEYQQAYRSLVIALDLQSYYNGLLTSSIWKSMKIEQMIDTLALFLQESEFDIDLKQVTLQAKADSAAIRDLYYRHNDKPSAFKF